MILAAAREVFHWTTFDHLEWTYDGAFEELFSLGSGEFEQKFSKNSNARGVARGGCLSFDLTDTLDGHDGAICAAKHLELVHAHHLANPYTDLTNSICGTKY